MILKNKKAFSLIEVLAVLFIVSIALVGAMSLAHQSIRAQRLNTHTLIAYQLAQEGIELLRVIRDNNWLAANQQFNVLFPEGSYCLDYNSVVLDSQASPCTFYLVNGYYQHSGEANQITPYSRLIEISALDTPEAYPNNQAVLVSSTIYWEELGGTYTYTTATELYDWLELK